MLLRILAHPDVCSRRPLIDHYDTAVRGATVIPSGYADAGVIVIKRGARAGIALSVDGNPRYGAISARVAAAHAVVESARNVAAVGAQPIGLTDCLNYGDPNDPAAYLQMAEGIEGLAEAANALSLNEPGEPLAFVSGNVSLYNQSATGRAIAPSAIVACIGRVDDVGKTVTMQIAASGSALMLLGRRSTELGGSVLQAICGGGNDELPALDYGEACASIRAAIAAIRAGCVTAAHDISDGGILACVAEMCLGGDSNGRIGARLASPHEWAADIDPVAAFFGETGGFVLEVPADERDSFDRICRNCGADAKQIGVTGGDALAVDGFCDVALEKLARAWSATLADIYG